MKAIVVYESVWGNTAAIARAIAEGIGEGATAASTAEAGPEVMEGVDLVVVGAPVFGFMLPNEGMRRTIANDPKHAGHPPDMSHPSLRSWLDALSKGSGRFAAFETRISWSPRGAVGDIAKRLKRQGYAALAEPERFLVTGTYGPLAEGEVERARAWGAKLTTAMMP
jgi:hypothetical protein